MNNISEVFPESQSRMMRFFRKHGLHSVAWSLRRLHVPVPKSALVLEVGSGGNPYFRSNVLIDAYEHTRERHYVPLVADRPTVLGYVENLPFQDKSFDFVIASHVLEHSSDPERFLSELQRVAKAGYIEVPDAFMERLNPYLDHRLEITVRNNRLNIRKKAAWRIDPELVELYEHGANAVIAGKAIPSYPFEFHVRYYWNEQINYVILNPRDDASWPSPESSCEKRKALSMRAHIKSLILNLIRRSFSQNTRNRNLDITPLLRCPTCMVGHLRSESTVSICEECGASYEIVNGIPRLFSLAADGAVSPR